MFTKLKLILLSLVLSFGLLSQEKALERAIDFENQKAYYSAIKEYEKVVKQGGGTPEIYRKLARFNLDMRLPEESHKWFEALLETREYNTEDQLLFAEVLRQNEKYFESTVWSSQYFMATQDIDYAEFVVTEDYYERFKTDSAKIDILNLESINSEFNEICPTIRDGKMYFSSNMDFEFGIRYLDIYTNSNFLNLYTVPLDGIQPSGKVKAFSANVNGVFHDSNLAFENDELVYFTRNQKKHSEETEYDQGFRKLKIVKAKKTAAGWNVIDDFPYNSVNYSVGHPTISPDGKFMVFISDMPGGHGGTDLYILEKNENGNWGEPVNMGPSINSKGNEKFPYLFIDNSLYYSSDGKHGLGGLDIFVSPYLQGKHLNPYNIGYPINSSRDDFGFFYDAKNHSGYFSSNRKNSKGTDDIYAYQLNDTLNYLVKGKVMDFKSKKRVKNLKAVLLDLDDNVIQEVDITDGSFMFDEQTLRNSGFKVVIKDDSGLYQEINSGMIKGSGINSGIDLGIMFTEKMPIIFKGILSDHNSGRYLHGIKITLYNKDSGQIEGEYVTGKGGEFEFSDLKEWTNYQIRLEKDGYFTRTVDFQTSDSRLVDFNQLDWGVMERIERDVPVILDEYSEINFDYDKYNIRKDAEKALNYLIILLLENPYVSIELSAHTDCTGNDDYNLELSYKRAQSAYEYLVVRGGINPDQVSWKGYGESKPLIKCGRRCQKCTMQDHARNRRIEFKVISTEFSEKVKDETPPQK